MKLFNPYMFCTLTLLLATACSSGPKPIAYGTDGCHFCRMTIVDRQHAAEIITDKGKVYKFDSVECMLNSREELGEDRIAQYLCNTYGNPGELSDVTTLRFLISEGIPSPMGANLTAFETEIEAAEARERHGGTLYDWNALLTYFKTVSYVYGR